MFSVYAYSMKLYQRMFLPCETFVYTSLQELEHRSSWAKESCAILVYGDTFAECREHLDATPFYEDCLFDACRYNTCILPCNECFFSLVCKNGKFGICALQISMHPSSCNIITFPRKSFYILVSFDALSDMVYTFNINLL